MKIEDIKIILLSSLGGMLEFYDFIIFAIYAPIIGQLFFPESSKLVSVMYGLMSFALGYIARPIGGMVFGHFGDKYGRKRIFSATIFIMGISTLLMGLLPTYEDIGVAASILFVLLRLLQGMAIGGELSGAITFISEHIDKRKALAMGFLYAFVNLGILFASAVFIITSDNSYGWRIAALIGAIAAIISYYIREKLSETPVYQKLKEKSSIPLFFLAAKEKVRFISSFLLMSFLALIVSIGFLFVNTYLNILSIPKHNSDIITMIGLVIFTTSTLLSGYCADRLIKADNLLMLASLAIVFFGSVMFFTAGKNYFSNFSYYLFSFSSGPAASLIPLKVSKLFKTKVRYSGVGLSYNLAFALFGGLSPLLIVFL
ncbi:MFS transporter [Piscirickettsia litoralis]|uniref:Major facilitator superfamily (MFS) profile domain-containing protein n=1 Tax=Piscirickettsia litoralis TaxID=1891921 RepID=A0ABX2ZXX0_9GAMM|nr:MFS transporter [Piscirickettsia litoralis]ODN41461.1 hypothetical protein BGC07_15170 [Piscirickettsia litoralis]